MEKTKKRLVWKKNRIVSVKLRNGVYALGQMWERKRMLLFKYFSKDNQWDNIKLSSDDVLFSCTPLKAFLKRSEIEIITSIKPLLDYKEPTIALISNGSGFSKKVVEIGDYKREVFVYGDGTYSIVEYDPTDSKNNTHSSGLYKTVIKNNVDLYDYNEIKNLGFVSNLEDYPNLNERLYLCWLLGENINPNLDIDIGLPLEDYHRTYIDIISGDTNLSDLGY